MHLLLKSEKKTYLVVIVVRNQTKIQSRQYFAEKEGDFMTFDIYYVQTIAFVETPDYVVTELEATNLKVFYQPDLGGKSFFFL